MKLRITINRNGRNKEEKTKLSYGWVNDWIEPEELIQAVGNGWAGAATWFKAKKHSAEKYLGSIVIVFDFDGELRVKNSGLALLLVHGVLSPIRTPAIKMR